MPVPPDDERDAFHAGALDDFGAHSVASLNRSGTVKHRDAAGQLDGGLRTTTEVVPSTS